MRVFQSSKDEPLVIYGTGFKGEPVLNFDPPIWSPSNYTIKVMSEGQMELNLVEGSVWKKLPGALVLKGINVGDGDVSPNGLMIELRQRPAHKNEFLLGRKFHLTKIGDEALAMSTLCLNKTCNSLPRPGPKGLES